MVNKYRGSSRAWIVIALSLAVMALGFHALNGDQRAEASRLAQSAVTPAFNYQGTLRGVDGSLITGERDVTVRIYDGPVGGSMLHDETFTGVPVRDGVFNVVLGDVKALPATIYESSSPRYLGVTVAPDPEMVPRQRLYPVPWSLQSNQANRALRADVATKADSADELRDGASVSVTDLDVSGAVELGLESSFTMFDGLGNFTIGRGIGPGGPALSVEADGDVIVGVLRGGSAAFQGLLRASTVEATSGFRGKCINDGELWRGTCNQDVAETFAATELTEPGDVVVLQPQAAEEPTVQLSQRPYAGQLMGVVSSNPGLVFDRGNTFLAGDNANLITEDRTPVAMIGRVPVRISLENGAIAVGDPLASASVPGAAMKATQAGQIIGYAMQTSAEARDGKILAWLQLGYYIPPASLARLNGSSAAGAEAIEAATTQDLAQEFAQLRAENAALVERIMDLEDQR